MTESGSPGPEHRQPWEAEAAALTTLDPISLLVRTAFTGEYALGSFIAFAVTVSGVGVSAPLWGVAAGVLIVRLAARS